MKLYANWVLVVLFLVPLAGGKVDTHEYPQLDQNHCRDSMDMIRTSFEKNSGVWVNVYCIDTDAIK